MSNLHHIDTFLCPRLPAGLIHREKGSLHFFLHPAKPRWIVTNQLGSDIVGLCDGRSRVASIADVLSKRYGVEYARVEEDTLRFVGQLDRSGLLLSEGTEPTVASECQPVIRSVFLHLTGRCNLRCIHCYASGDGGGNEGLDGTRIRELIDELAASGGRALTVSGGEPLLRGDWYDLLAYASQRLQVTLNTNGTLIDRSAAVRLAAVRPKIQVSLDGPTGEVHDAVRGTGTFDRAVRGIRELQDHGLGEDIIVSMTLMRQNIASAPEMVSFVERLGVPSVRFLPLHSQGRARSSWESLDASVEQYLRWFRYVYYNEEVRSSALEISGGLTGFLLYLSPDDGDQWCGIGKRVVIDHDGTVYLCSLLMDDALALGNVRTMSLEEIQRSPRYREMASICSSRKERIPKCVECKWGSLCQAACPAIIYLSKGTWWSTDDFCDFRRQLFEDAVFEYAERKAAGNGRSS